MPWLARKNTFYWILCLYMNECGVTPYYRVLTIQIRKRELHISYMYDGLSCQVVNDGGLVSYILL